jgi:diguanylate cyclase (GGDEF)-like protein
MAGAERNEGFEHERRHWSREPEDERIAYLTEEYTRELNEILAGQRSVDQYAEELARLRQKLEREATRDPNTNLLNVGAVLASLPAEMELAGRARRKVGILFVDIDHFKQVNDTEGHSAGNRVIAGFADILRGACEKHKIDERQCITARWGGEEFVWILLNAKEEDLLKMAETVGMTVKDTLAVRAGLKDIKQMTVSIGATLAKKGEDMHNFIDRADALMYQAKEAGRNRAVIGVGNKKTEEVFV